MTNLVGRVSKGGAVQTAVRPDGYGRVLAIIHNSAKGCLMVLVRWIMRGRIFSSSNSKHHCRR